MTRGQVLLFWDYDTQWGAERSRSGPKTWGPAEFTNTDRILTLLDRYAVSSTFACVGAAALPGARPYHDPVQIRAMSAAGHEVGSHSWAHDWLPGLDPVALRESLQRSRDALEACIQAPVTTFVPPWNQPYDHWPVGSLSLSERRETWLRPRTDVRRLCQALTDAGYRFVRLAYRSAWRRLHEAVTRREHPVPARVSVLRGQHYVLLNTPAGFGPETMAMTARVADEGGLAIVWAHPHSLHLDGPQHERYFEPWLEAVARFREQGRLEVILPRQLTGDTR